jgi:hypothetical protein
MSLLKFVYTRFEDGGIDICRPVPEVISIMGNGGWWNLHHNPRGFIDTQIERQIADGRNPDAARRFALAVHFGGKTTAEALSIVRDRDCLHRGYDIAPIEWEELPSTRWFRNAWVRNSNGAVGVDLEKAKPIHWKHLKQQLLEENGKRGQDLYGLDEIKIPVDAFKSYIKHASSIDELERIWPQELPRKLQ